MCIYKHSYTHICTNHMYTRVRTYENEQYYMMLCLAIAFYSYIHCGISVYHHKPAKLRENMYRLTMDLKAIFPSTLAIYKIFYFFSTTSSSSS